MAAIRWRYIFSAVLAFLPAESGHGQVAGEAVSVQPLRTVAEVRGLTYEQARSGLPVVLRVVVIAHLFTGFDGQDGSGGVFFETEEVPPLGERVEIVGNVTGGLYSPYVVVDDVRRLGKAEHPAPLPLSPDFLQTGVGDNRWLEAEGLIVRVDSGESGHWADAVLVSGPTELEVRFGHRDAELDRVAVKVLEGAWVRIRGSGAPRFNDARQRIGSLLLCPGVDFVEVLESAGGEGLAPISLAEIASWDHRRDRSSRVRTSGVVTLVEGPESLVIEADGRGARVRTLAGQPADVGDRVEVTGFPMGFGYHVGLKHATVTPGSDEAGGQLGPVGETEPFARDRAFRLVTLKGALMERGARYLGIRSGEHLVPIQFGENAEEAVRALRAGSEVAVTGVKLVDADIGGEVRSVVIAMRGPDDLRVIAAPSWWTPRRYFAAMGALAFAIAGFLAWNLTLRRRVREQTAEIGIRIAAHAALEERNRIARELHDTLSQGFVGVGYQLASVANHLESSPERAGEKLRTARRMVEHSLVEARRSLADLRSDPCATGGFAESLETEVRQICGEANLACDLSLGSRETERLSDAVRHELRRIVVEAVTNAVRHARANLLAVSLSHPAGAVGGLELLISDDGVGFSPELAESLPGHFGLRGLRERAARLGADFEVESGPGKGSKVRLKWNAGSEAGLFLQGS